MLERCWATRPQTGWQRRSWGLARPKIRPA
jgi:hypothetical protein